MRSRSIQKAMWLPILIVLVLLLAAACGPVREADPALLGERRKPAGDVVDGCAPATARELAAFVEALATGGRSFGKLCARLGPPDWETGSGLIIMIYELDDGSEVWLGFGGLQSLNYAFQVAPDGQRTDLLSD